MFPDQRQLMDYTMPTNLDDAFGCGFLVIECLSGGNYSLSIANENYTGAFHGLCVILYDWAMGENYVWE